MQLVPPKRRHDFTGLRDVTTHKTDVLNKNAALSCCPHNRIEKSVQELPRSKLVSVKSKLLQAPRSCFLFYPQM